MSLPEIKMVGVPFSTSSRKIFSTNYGFTAPVIPFKYDMLILFPNISKVVYLMIIIFVFYGWKYKEII